MNTDLRIIRKDTTRKQKIASIGGDVEKLEPLCLIGEIPKYYTITVLNTMEIKN